MTFHKALPKVAILMATYNGAEYIEEQLNSIKDQTHDNWELHVSDDGSSDRTLDLVKNFAATHPKKNITIYKGEQKGFANNFIGLINNKNISADYYALCDQDDVWMPQKIEVAINRLSENCSGTPGLYCSRVTYTDKDLKRLGDSIKFCRRQSFENAVVQNIAGGNTFVFNEETRKCLLRSGNVDVPFHDWWIYILVTAHDGFVVYDTEPRVYYRQHIAASVGGSLSIKSRIFRFLRMLGGEIKLWNRAHFNALNKIKSNLPPDKIRVMNLYFNSDGYGVIGRLCRLAASKVYRQTPKGSISLYLSCVFNKL